MHFDRVAKIASLGPKQSGIVVDWSLSAPAFLMTRAKDKVFTIPQLTSAVAQTNVLRRIIRNALPIPSVAATCCELPHPSRPSEETIARGEI